MKIFFDTEFTGLKKDTTLISFGAIAENGNTFYAETTDYDKNQLDEWLQTNVIDNLKLEVSDTILGENEPHGVIEIKDSGDGYWNNFEVVGTKRYVAGAFQFWIRQFLDPDVGDEQNYGKIEMWSDCLSYDWVLFNDMYGHAFNIPKYIYYIPFDICTMFKMKGIDPDISREEFINNSIIGNKHNALYDAKVIKACYNKLTSL